MRDAVDDGATFSQMDMFKAVTKRMPEPSMRLSDSDAALAKRTPEHACVRERPPEDRAHRVPVRDA